MRAVFKPHVAQSDTTSLVQRLLDVCDHRLDQIRALQDASQRLEEEIAVLKGRDEVRPRTVRGLKDLS